MINKALAYFKADSKGRYAARSSLSPASIAKFTYLLNLGGCEFCVFAALLAHVFVVLCQRSQEQMGRIAARWGVATVKNRQRRVFTVRQKPCCAMGCGSMTRAVVDLAVSFWKFCASPYPAVSRWAMARRFINLWPESFFEGAVNV